MTVVDRHPEDLGGSRRPAAGSLNAYLPRVLLERLVRSPDAAVLAEDGTIVFVDISGFTKLSERLARAGREGAEHLVETIGSCFSALLAEAYADGGSLLKFGGDALLLWFAGEEHAWRACVAAAEMRRTLRRIGRVRAGASSVVLRMSVGVHSGTYDMFLVGGSHREYLPAGPAVSAVVALEAHAEAGQILVSEATAAALPERCLGACSGPGILLARVPALRPWMPQPAAELPAEDAVAGCLSTVLRAHLQSEPAQPEHRTATVSFLQFGELDELIAGESLASAASAVEEVVLAAQEAADRHKVCILGSDIAADGGKLLFSAGVPRAIGDDEERMLLAMREIVDAGTRLPVRVGVNRGYVFAGEVGPPYRRTYAVMGDVVNLAARLAAKAPWRSVYTTASALDRTDGRFAAKSLPPFTVKGKSRPITAFEVGAPLRAQAQGATPERLPLIGRDRELEILAIAITAAARGEGALIELIGEAGSGTSRLLAESRERAGSMRTIRVMCERYTQSIPYITWREILRELLQIGWDAPDAVALERLRERVDASHKQLRPWLPLLAIAIGIEAPATRDVDELSPDARAAKLHEVVLDLLEPELAVPTLVLIEHLDLMDEASSGLLGALADRLVATPWLLVGTRRDPAAGFVMPASVRVDVGPLSPGGALALAEATPEAHLLPPHTIAMAVERSAGNAEFLLDLLSAAAVGGSGELPDTIESAASARIDALDPGDRALVRRAAVLGMSFREARLTHVLDAEAAPHAAAWARLSSVLVREADGYARFASPIICEVAYAGLPFGLRRRLHAAIGEALERDLGTDIDADPAVLSLHFSRAGDHDRAWRYAVLGAERATARFAVADAARLYRLAIDAHRGAEVSGAELAAVWEELGAALAAIGEVPAAEHAFASARRLMPGDVVAQARICFRRGQIAERVELSSAVRWMRRGLRELEQVAGDAARGWRARLVAELAWIRQRQRRYREAERLCREALAEGEASGELRAVARACYTLDWVLYELGRFDEATYSPRALEIYRELGDPEQEGRVLNNLGGLAYWRGRWQDAIDLYRQAGGCSQRAGHSADLAFTDANIGEILADQGNDEDGAAYLSRARRVWSSTGDRQGVAYATMLLGRLAARAGRIDDGLVLLREALDDMRRFHVDFYADFAAALIVEAEALGGDPGRALALGEERLTAESGYGPLVRRARGIALARLGDRGAALAELWQARDAARDGGEDFETALALDALAAIGAASEVELTERTAIFARLGVVATPAIADLHRDAQPLTVVASA